MSISDKYVIAGLGVTRLGRVPEMSAMQLEADAVRRAIADSGVPPKEIDGYIYQPSGARAEDDFVPRHLGLTPRFYWALQAGGSTASAMVHAAIGAIESGLATTVVCAYGANLATGRSGIGGMAGSTLGSFGMFGPAALHALCARRHMHEYGTTNAQLGMVAVTTREYAALNPEAWFYERPMTIDDYFNSRMVVDPLRLLDICLITDGGAAVVVTTSERAKNLPARPVHILGIGQGHQLLQLQSDEQWTRLDVKRAKETAFGMAGINVGDIDVAELYDCFTITVLMELEGYGFCGVGEAGSFVEEGNLRLDGAIPTNTSGGELSWTYMQGFSPLVEGIRQMRGECGPRQVKDANICLVGTHGAVTAGTLNPMSIGHGTLILRRQ
jgi:acetyl-CoA acetyltransferase